MRLKTDGSWIVDLTDEGYEIRPFGRSGAKVVVTRDLEVVVSSSSKICMTFKEWEKLSSEINEGELYMANNPPAPSKERTIKPSEVSEMSFYKDKLGRGIFEVGCACITSNTYGFSQNRSGCPFVRGYVDNFEDIKEIITKTKGDTTVVDIVSNEFKNASFVDFDSRARKATGLTRKMWSSKEAAPVGHKIVVLVNGDKVLECVKTGNPYSPVGMDGEDKDDDLFME